MKLVEIPRFTRNDNGLWWWGVGLGGEGRND